MKRIGNTIKGQVMVEMSHEEWEAFRTLDNAIRGRLSGPILQHSPIESDCRDAFVCILAWCRAKMRVIELRQVADELETLLEDE